MYLRRVVVENVRGFKALDFVLERGPDSYAGWTVITGSNASGKTALLKAISLALVGPDTARSLQPTLDGWISQTDDQALIAIELVAGDRDRFDAGRRYEKPFWAEFRLSRRNDHTVFHPTSEYGRKRKGPTRGPWQDVPEGWFGVGYGPFRRLYGHSPEAQRLMSTKGKVSRFATMFREDATLAESDLWLRDLNYRKLEGDEQAETVLNQMIQILNSNFLENNLIVDRVDSDGLWLRQQDGTVLSLDNMSDGYRASLAMLVDIIRQLIDVYGSTELLINRSDGDAQIRHGGIVLIDEIDAHLHPEWQRKIGFWFKELFPQIQFIVTTHSALICQAADAHGLFHLPPPGSELEPYEVAPDDWQKVIAGKPDSILLGPAFGLEHTRSPIAVAARLRYAKLEAKRRAGGSLGPDEKKQLRLDLRFVTPSEDETPNQAAS